MLKNRKNRRKELSKERLNTHKEAIIDEVKLRQWEMRDLIFAALGISLVVGGILVTPNFPIVLGSLLKIIEELKGAKIPKAKLKRTIAALEKKEILFIEEKGESVFVHLKSWNQQVLQYSLKGILDFKKKEKKWNGKWFLVFFDVPEIQRNKRDYMRRLLKKIGFYQYQQSVYVFPYNCKEEVKLIKKIVEGGKYLKYIIADEIEEEKLVKLHFNLT